LKTIVFNGSVFEHNGNFGIATFFLNLFNQICNEINVTLWLGSDSHFSFPGKIKIVKDKSRSYFNRYDLFARFKMLRDRGSLYKRIGRHDIFHSVYDDFYEFADTSVCTIHDIIPEVFFDQANWASEQLNKKKTLVDKVSAIAVPSQSSKIDFERYYEKKVDTVVYHGHEHIPNGYKKFERIQNYFVYGGQRGSYKNFKLVVQAAAFVLPKVTNFKVAVFGPKFSNAEIRYLDYLGVKKCFIEIGFVSEEEKFSIIGSSMGLIYPSLLEGFGFPIIEGQKLGIPVLMSDIPSNREISGAVGFFYNPFDCSQLADRILQRFDSNCHDLISSGYNNLKRFSWDICGKKYLELYYSF
jgi:glycosyltransferase involved in cell wall biosynthesis